MPLGQSLCHRIEQAVKEVRVQGRRKEGVERANVLAYAPHAGVVQCARGEGREVLAIVHQQQLLVGRRRTGPVHLWVGRGLLLLLLLLHHEGGPAVGRTPNSPSPRPPNLLRQHESVPVQQSLKDAPEDLHGEAMTGAEQRGAVGLVVDDWQEPLAPLIAAAAARQRPRDGGGDLAKTLGMAREPRSDE